MPACGGLDRIGGHNGNPLFDTEIDCSRRTWLAVAVVGLRSPMHETKNCTVRNVQLQAARYVVVVGRIKLDPETA